MSEVPDPFGRTLFERRRPDGYVELEIAPGQEVCDFCSAPNPTWEYPCGPVAIVGNPNVEASDDPWAACDRCHELIEDGDVDVDAMAAEMTARQRAQPLSPGFGKLPLARQVALQRANVRAFLAGRTGPARPYRTT